MTNDRETLESILDRVRAAQDDVLDDARRRATVRRRLLDPPARSRPWTWAWAAIPAAVAVAALVLTSRPDAPEREARRAIGDDPDTSARSEAPRAGAVSASPDDDLPEARAPRRVPRAEARTPVPEAITVADASTSPAAPPEAPAAPSAEWRRLGEAAEYDAAIAAARGAGIEAILTQGTPEDLLLLGSIAQRASAPEAARVYRALRERFPGTEAAATAAFMLGRIAGGARDARGAATWLETYLSERPFGTHARDALGRLIEARTSLRDEAGARAAAESYLERYPRGPHAPLATRVLAAP